MSYLPMHEIPDGLGLDLLSLNSRGTGVGDLQGGGYRLYHRSDEEDNDQQNFGTGGGSSSPPYHYAQADPRGSPFASDDAPYIPQRRLQATHTTSFEGFQVGPEQLYLPQSSSPGHEVQENIELTTGFGYGSMSVGSSMEQDYFLPHYGATSTVPPEWGFNMGASSQHSVAGPSREISYGYPTHSIMTPAAGPRSSSSRSSTSSGYESYSQIPEADALPSEQETENYLRGYHSIPPDVPVNLNALPDAPHGKRPTAKLATLVQMAIWGSPRKKLTLQEIYRDIESRYAYYKNSGDSKWKGSIRHMLSLKQMFIPISRPVTEPGKGNYWTLDISGAGKDKRVRKRRDRGRHGKRSESTDSQDDEEPSISSPVELQEHQASSTEITTRPKRARSLPYPPSAATPAPSSSASTARVGLSQRARTFTSLSRGSSPATSDSSGPSASRAPSGWVTSSSPPSRFLTVEGQPPFRQPDYRTSTGLDSNLPPSMTSFGNPGYPSQGLPHATHLPPHPSPNVINLPPSREFAAGPVRYLPAQASSQSLSGTPGFHGIPATQTQSTRMQPRSSESMNFPASSGDQSRPATVAPDMLTRSREPKGKGRAT